MKRLVTYALGVFVCAMAVILGNAILAGSAQTQPGTEKKAEGVAGSKTCEGCHEEVMKNLGKTGMGRVFLKHPRNTAEELVCETCHGPGQAHADSGGEDFGDMIRFAKGSPTPTEKQNDTCLQCHRKKKLLFWDGSPHAMRDVGCTTCHNVHKASTQIANPSLLAKPGPTETCNPCHQQEVTQQMRFSHHPLREGKMSCTSCHNPHGTSSESLLKAIQTNELCYTCHAEKRGPFLVEHPPVVEDCGNCHVAHGSNYPKLLKEPEARSCRQCHTPVHQLDFNTRARRVAPHVAGRVCTSCHVNVHGSNHPSGMFLTR